MNNNPFNMNVPMFNIPGMNSGNFMSANQMQSGLNQSMSPQALSNPQSFNWANMNQPIGPGAGGNSSMWDMESMMGGQQGPGWLTGGAQALSGLANTWLGMQQYGLAKDSFNFNRGLATQNYENQAQLTNRGLEASLKRNAVATGQDPDQAVAQGMEKWGLDEKVGG